MRAFSADSNAVDMFWGIGSMASDVETPVLEISRCLFSAYTYNGYVTVRSIELACKQACSTVVEIYYTMWNLHCKCCDQVVQVGRRQGASVSYRYPVKQVLAFEGKHEPKPGPKHAASAIAFNQCSSYIVHILRAWR